MSGHEDDPTRARIHRAGRRGPNIGRSPGSGGLVVRWRRVEKRYGSRLPVSGRDAPTKDRKR